MSDLATTELWSIFDARRVKAPELSSIDALVNGVVGWFKNRIPALKRIQAQAKRVMAYQEEIQTLGATRFREEVELVREKARLDRLTDPLFERGVALTCEACWRALKKRPYFSQITGALSIYHGYIAEMATGEGKTLTASLTASLWAWSGRPVHVITVNDYLVSRDAQWNAPVYEMLGLSTGAVVHETPPHERAEQYRRNVVYVTSKELVADFLRDQISIDALQSVRPLTKNADSAWGGNDGLGGLRTAAQTSVGLLAGPGARQPLNVPGLFRVLVDEADSLLIDEAVTPLIISNSPTDDANAKIYEMANEIAKHLEVDRDFKIDWTVRNVELLPRGQYRLNELTEHVGQSGFWRGERRREELVTQALTALHCYVRDEQYLIAPDNTVQIIDEFTGRVMADRSWRHGLHQAIEIKEGVRVTADKENLARLSFQRFYRQYPLMGGMTGTAWESNAELWQIYQRAILRIPPNKPNIRVQLPTKFFEKSDERYDAVVERVAEIHAIGAPVLVGTRSVLASQEVSKRLTAKGLVHRVLNASQTAQEASIVSEAGQRGKITVATNMAGRGTDISLGKGVVDVGGLHVISTEPHGSYRVDRQLYGRAARQGDPGCAQQFSCAEDDLFIRHTPHLRKFWRTIGAARLIRIAQGRAEKLARFNRKQVLKNDDWMDQAVPF